MPTAERDGPVTVRRVRGRLTVAHHVDVSDWAVRVEVFRRVAQRVLGRALLAQAGFRALRTLAILRTRPHSLMESQPAAHAADPDPVERGLEHRVDRRQVIAVVLVAILRI